MHDLCSIKQWIYTKTKVRGQGNFELPLEERMTDFFNIFNEKLDHIPNSCLVLTVHMVKVVNIVRVLSIRHIDTPAPQLQRWSLKPRQ